MPGPRATKNTSSVSIYTRIAFRISAHKWQRYSMEARNVLLSVLLLDVMFVPFREPTAVQSFVPERRPDNVMVNFAMFSCGLLLVSWNYIIDR